MHERLVGVGIVLSIAVSHVATSQLIHLISVEHRFKS